MVDLTSLFRHMLERKASDLHLKVGRPPLLRVIGSLEPVDGLSPLTSEDLEDVAKILLAPQQWEALANRREVDTAYFTTEPEPMRLRINAFWQRGTLEFIMRYITGRLPDIEELSLPPVLKKVALLSRGMVLVTGTVGSGKSTTIASMINYINQNRPIHIVSIEDPIEFTHDDIKASITQREVGIDTESYSQALRAALREDPDVLFIGEIRDVETVETAMHAAETGHLVLSTMHTIDAVQTVDRLVDFFPPTQQGQIRAQFGNTVEAVISQRLVPRKDGKGRVPAVEIMLGTPTIRGLIREGKTRELRSMIAQGAQQYDMQTFDQSLVALFKQDLISIDNMMAEATSANDIKLMLSGIITSTASAKEILTKSTS